MNEVNEAHLATVRRLCKSPEELLRDLTPEIVHFLHAGAGIASESGEIWSTLKKSFIYRQPLDRDNLKEEVGDLMFYVHQLCDIAGFSLDDALQANIDKLAKRYPQGYSDKAATERADKKPIPAPDKTGGGA